MGVAQLGYVRLAMQDPRAWADFGENVMGFKSASHAAQEGAFYLRMDEAPFRYIIEKSDTDRFLAAGFQMSDEAGFNTLLEALRTAGVEVSLGDEVGCRHRAVAAYAQFSDPSGNLVEVYYGREDDQPFTPGHGISSFKTGQMGLGHLVLPAPQNAETEAFYTNLMGFGVSDDLILPPFAENMPDQRILFLHADNPRHHTLGLYNFPNPVGVVHLMAELSTIDEVGACMDRVKQAGMHIFASLGRHANDQMVSFYFFAPGGIGIEVGFDGLQVEDWSRFTPTKSTIGDLWGHEYDFPVVGE